MKKLVYYGGDGFGVCREDDPYKVKCDKPNLFGKFSEAKAYYDKVVGEKAIWNIRTGELLDSWFYENGDTEQATG